MNAFDPAGELPQVRHIRRRRPAPPPRRLANWRDRPQHPYVDDEVTMCGAAPSDGDLDWYEGSSGRFAQVACPACVAAYQPVAIAAPRCVP